MSCGIQAVTNGGLSILGEQLYNIVNDESEAVELHSYFLTNEFKEEFGDFRAHYNSSDPSITNEQLSLDERTDENGEPKLHFDKKVNKHYYKDKYEEKVY